MDQAAENRSYDFEDVECSAIRELSDYWFSLCDGEAFPSADVFDPLSFPEHIMWMSIVDVLDGGKDFGFRLVGTRMARMFGSDLTGKKISEGTRPHVEGRLGLIYQYSLLVGGPVWGCGPVGNVFGRRGFHSEACILPLSRVGGEISRLVHMTQLRDEKGNWLD